MATYIFDESGAVAVTADGPVWTNDPYTNLDDPWRIEGEIAAAVALTALIGGFPVLRITAATWPALTHRNLDVAGLTADGTNLPASIRVLHRWATPAQLANADLRSMMSGHGHPATHHNETGPVVGPNGELTGFDQDGYLTVTHPDGRILRRIPDRGAARNTNLPSRWSGQTWRTRGGATVRIDDMTPGHAWRAAQVMLRNAYASRTNKAISDEAFAAEQGFTSTTRTPTSTLDAERMVRASDKYRALLARGRGSLKAGFVEPQLEPV